MENGLRGIAGLDVWKLARRLRSEIYKASQTLPKDETYALISQLSRPSISVTDSFAEDHRRYPFQGNIRFCRPSRASYELRDHCTTALDSRYISKNVLDELNALSISLIKLLNGYIPATMTKQPNAKKST